MCCLKEAISFQDGRRQLVELVRRLEAFKAQSVALAEPWWGQQERDVITYSLTDGADTQVGVITGIMTASNNQLVRRFRREVRARCRYGYL